MRAPLALHCDTTPLEAVLSELSMLAVKLPAELVERLVGALDAGAEFFIVEADSRPAAGTVHLAVRIEPSEALLGLMAACRARHVDLECVESCLCQLEASRPEMGADDAPPSAGEEGGAR